MIYPIYVFVFIAPWQTTLLCNDFCAAPLDLNVWMMITII